MSNQKIDLEFTKGILTESVNFLQKETKEEKEERLINEIIKRQQEKQEKIQEIENWKQEKEAHYKVKEQKIAEELINVLTSTQQHYGLILTGEGGIGKTLLTTAQVQKKFNKEDWEISNGYTTPLALYEFLRINRNKEVLILDDMEGIFNNPISVSIIKGALWETKGARVVRYNSKSDKSTGGKQFFMKAKILILCNNIPKENETSTRALISRTILYRLNFSFKEKMRICKSFIHKNNTIKEGDKNLIKQILKEEVTEATKDFNFRTLRKLIAFVQYDKEKALNLFQNTTEIDMDKKIMLEAISKSKKKVVRIAYFIEETAKTRRTYYRLLKKYNLEDL